jgi:hypothetical protein
MKLKRLLFLILASGIFVGAVLLTLPDEEAKAYSVKLSNALNGARSITFVEFSHREFDPESVPELVFSRVPASPRQIEALRSATGSWFTPMTRGPAQCFDPHQRVEIVGPDGRKLQFRVCFHCNNFVFADEHRCVALPTIWRVGLSRLFASAGMPPRSSADYSILEKKHPDYHLVEEARRLVDEAFLKSNARFRTDRSKTVNDGNGGRIGMAPQPTEPGGRGPGKTGKPSEACDDLPPFRAFVPLCEPSLRDVYGAMETNPSEIPQSLDSRVEMGNVAAPLEASSLD